ncbi:hypothetical protein ACLQ94_04635, partial [Gallibacterium anatis]
RQSKKTTPFLSNDFGKMGLSAVWHNDVMWNFLAMALCGLCFSLGGGCPGKQLVHIGEGDNDSALFILGMLLGAAAAHNFSLAASGAGVSQFTPFVVIIGFIFCIYVGLSNRIKA